MTVTKVGTQSGDAPGRPRPQAALAPWGIPEGGHGCQGQPGREYGLPQRCARTRAALDAALWGALPAAPMRLAFDAGRPVASACAGYRRHSNGVMISAGACRLEVCIRLAFHLVDEP